MNDRKKKIEMLKCILSGSATLDDLKEKSWQVWNEITDHSEDHGKYKCGDDVLTYEQVKKLENGCRVIVMNYERKIPESTPGYLTLNLK